MPAVPIVGVLWYDQQALSCSVQQAPGGWRVSLWKSGLSDPVPDDTDLDWMDCWTLPDDDVQMPVSLDGLTIQQTEQQAGLDGHQQACVGSSGTGQAQTGLNNGLDGRQVLVIHQTGKRSR